LVIKFELGDKAEETFKFKARERKEHFLVCKQFFRKGAIGQTMQANRLGLHGFEASKAGTLRLLCAYAVP